MHWVMPIIAILLAFYGWYLITQLAKRREAYELYSSVVSLLEKLDTDAKRAWKHNPASLDEYTEWKLVSKRDDVERRLELIKKYYSRPSKPAKITTRQLSKLRILLTTTSDLVPSEEPRNVAIHRLTADMIHTLLDESYEYINRPIWWPF